MSVSRNPAQIVSVYPRTGRWSAACAPVCDVTELRRRHANRLVHNAAMPPRIALDPEESGESPPERQYESDTDRVRETDHESDHRCLAPTSEHEEDAGRNVHDRPERRSDGAPHPEHLIVTEHSDGRHRAAREEGTHELEPGGPPHQAAQGVELIAAEQFASVADERAREPEAAHEDDRGGHERDEALEAHVVHAQEACDENRRSQHVDLRKGAARDDRRLRRPEGSGRRARRSMRRAMSRYSAPRLPRPLPRCVTDLRA